VTGYDGSPEASLNSPGICTYKTSYSALGMNAMFKLYNMINKMDDSTLISNVQGTLITNTSCGCNSHIPSISADKITNDELIEQRFLDNNMSNSLLNTDNLNDFAITASNWIFLCLNEKYYENETFDVCLFSNWDVVNSDGLSSNIKYSEISEEVFSLFGSQAFEKFLSKQMFPTDHLREDELSVSFFAPIHYEDHCFGYAILTLFGIADGFSMSYPRFCKDLGNSLECLCIRNRLKSMTYRAFLSDARDALTGAYRNSTLIRFWNEVTERVKLYDEKLHLCLCSVSGLQQINESYGQVEGDKILMQVSSVLMGSCHNGELCIRSEGNKFFLIGSVSNDTADSELLEKEISSKIERYNQKSGKPYRIKVFISASLTQAQFVSDCEKMYDELIKSINAKKNSEHIRTEQLYYADFTQLRRDIYSNPEKDWSVNICCEKLGMSMSHFQRLYKSIFNTSCMRDIQNSKLRHAKELLLHTGETLQSIAEKSGYDYSHFMRLFKKEVGMTPTEYRNGFQPKQNE
ncbi:MAG: helix-turn-helix domain-containing protein, partial [Ruminococcus sp.]